MKIGEPTVSWPTDPSSFYIHAMYHTFFWGPYPSVEEVAAAKLRMTAIDPYWDYDCSCVYKGDITPENERRVDKLEHVPLQ